MNGKRRRRGSLPSNKELKPPPLSNRLSFETDFSTGGEPSLRGLDSTRNLSLFDFGGLKGGDGKSIGSSVIVTSTDIYKELGHRLTRRTELSKRLRKLKLEIRENEMRIKMLEETLGISGIDKRVGKESRQISLADIENIALPEHSKEGTPSASPSRETIEVEEKEREMFIFLIPKGNLFALSAANLLIESFNEQEVPSMCILPDQDDCAKVNHDGNPVKGRAKGIARWKWQFQETLLKFEANKLGRIIVLAEGYGFETCKSQLWELNEVGRRRLLHLTRLIVFDGGRPVEEQVAIYWQNKEITNSIGYPMNFFPSDCSYWEGSESLWKRIETFFRSTDWQVGDLVDAKHVKASGWQPAIVKKIHRGNKKFDIEYKDGKNLREIWGRQYGAQFKCPREKIKQKEENPLVGLACSQPLLFAARHNMDLTTKYLIKWSKASIGVISGPNTGDVNCKDEFGNTPLHFACQSGYVEVMRVLLHARADPTIVNNQNMTCLVLAAGQGFKSIVEELIVKFLTLRSRRNINDVADGARLDLSEALRMAACKGHLSTAAALIKNKADVNGVDSGRRSALVFAAREGHIEMCKYLLALEADYERSDKYGQTPLLWACAEGQLQVISILLEGKADMEAEDNDGKTPLLWAASEGHNEICEMLLEWGANIECTDAEYERTALMRAVMNGPDKSEEHLNTIATLIEYQADLEMIDGDGKTAFMIATEFSNTSTIEALIDLKADVNIQDYDGRTALIHATKDNKQETVQYLINLSVDVSKRDKFGWTALMWAAKRGLLNIMELLIEADPEGVNSEVRGVTVLMRAATEGHTDAMLLLYRNKADLEARERSENQTALMRAAQKGHVETVKALLAAGANVEAEDDSKQTVMTLARNKSLMDVVQLLEQFEKDAQFFTLPEVLPTESSQGVGESSGSLLLHSSKPSGLTVDFRESVKHMGPLTSAENKLLPEPRQSLKRPVRVWRANTSQQISPRFSYVGVRN